MISPCKIPHICHGLAVLRRGLLVQRHGRGAARQQSLAHGGAEVDAPEPATAVRQEGLSHGPELWGLCVGALCKYMYIYTVYGEIPW